MSSSLINLPEKWKPVVGFEGLYEVSDYGRVRSLDRSVKYTSRYGSFYMNFKGKLLKLNYSRADGHLIICLSKQNFQYGRFVHHLVLEAFVGKRKKNQECRHLDGNPLNNKISNLKWGTKAENGADVRRHGSRQGEKHPGAKLTLNQVIYIRNSKERGLASRFGVSRAQICRIKAERSWTHV